MKRKYLFVLVILIISTIILILLPSDYLGTDFISALVRGQEDTVNANLSADFRATAQLKCPNGKTVGCIEVLIQPDWGQLQEVHFVIGSDATNTQLYHTFWSNLSDPVSIVLLTIEEEGKTLVNGWRGFIVSGGEENDSRLLRGEKRDNELTVSY